MKGKQKVFLKESRNVNVKVKVKTSTFITSDFFYESES